MKSCYTIAVKPADHHRDILLAGQNYRIFYDAGQVSFDEASVEHHFDPRAYSRVYIDDSQTGDIGFVSISIDGRQLTDNTIELPGAAGWTELIDLCFDKVDDRPISLTWARRSKTSQFASAEVAMSEWKNASRQQALLINEINDIGVEETANTAELEVFPNPFVATIQVSLDQFREADRVVISDAIGRTIIEQRIKGESSTILDMSSYFDGIFTLSIYDVDQRPIATQQIIKVGAE
ncbi:MAG: T9SS type A sorting domain-containing protein [Bacteroidota bacterium]